MAALPESIEAHGVVLRRWSVDDAPALHDAVTSSIDHLRPWMGWISFEPLTLDQRRDLIAGWAEAWVAGGDVVCGIWQDGAVVGAAGLHHRIGPGGLEIGYWVRADCTGRGLATAASRALTDLAFTSPDIEVVEIHHDVANLVSRRIPEKLGYEWIGEIDEHRDPAGPAETGRDGVWRTTRAAWLDRAI